MATMADLLSDAAVAVELRPTAHDATVDDSLLFDAEAALVASVAPGRYRDFVLGRRCARLATEALGHVAAPVLRGEHREPLWASGLVGAITHTEGYVGAAVARSAEVWSVGVDAEPDAPLPDGVQRRIVRPDEKPLLSLSATGVAAADRLVFSAKESVYKAWFPLTGRWLGFDQARLEIDPTERRFLAHLLVDDLPVVDGRQVTSFEGRYASSAGVLLTAVQLLRS